jgi:molybdate transport system ATP-binding protein
LQVDFQELSGYYFLDMRTKTPASHPPSALLHLHQAEVRRQDRTVLSGVSLTLHQNQNLMILGPNGAGKSTLLALLRGDIWPVSNNGHPTRQFLVNGQWQASPLGWKEHTALVSPEIELRYRILPGLSCAQVMATGLEDTLRPLTSLSSEQRQKLQDMSATFGLTSLLDQPFAVLSSGEAQKVLIVRALLHEPHLLFWDEVGTGLDKESRTQVMDLLSTLTRKKVQIIASTHRPEELVSSMHQIVLIHNGQVQGPFSPQALFSGKSSPRQRSEDKNLTHQLGTFENSITPHKPRTPEMPLDGNSEPGNVPVQQAYGSINPKKIIAAEVENRPVSKEAAAYLHLDKVTLSIQGRPIFGPLNWTMRAEEHWLIQGPNGSGKSTLLRLLAGEVHPSSGSLTRHPPLYSQTLQGLRQKIGLFTPELIPAHNRPQTALHTVLSGLRGQIGYRDRFTPAEKDQAMIWLQTLECEHLAGQEILALSSGQLRRVLLARALVHNPHLLLMDEPCAGLDQNARREFLALLDRLAEENIQTILVSHRTDDVFSAVNRKVILAHGQLTEVSLS